MEKNQLMINIIWEILMMIFILSLVIIGIVFLGFFITLLILVSIVAVVVHFVSTFLERKIL